MRLIVRLILWALFFSILWHIHEVNRELRGIYQWAYAQYHHTDSLLKESLGPLIGASIGAFLAWLALKTNAAVSIRNKRLDTILHCNTRYDALYETRKTIEASYANARSVPGWKTAHRRTDSIPASDPQVRAYFRRYWGLKSDQLDYWLAGYVDPETLASWFLSTVDLLNDNNNTRRGYQAPDRTAKIRLSDSIEEMRVNHLTANERLTELVDFFQRHVVHISDADVRYAALLHYLRIIERNERGLISRLNKNTFKRFTVSSFSYVLLKKDDAEYANLSTQNKIKNAFRKTAVKISKSIEFIEACLTLSLHDNRKYLQRSIERHPAFIAPPGFKPVTIESLFDKIKTPSFFKKSMMELSAWLERFE